MNRSASAPVVRATALSTMKSTPKWTFRGKPDISKKTNQIPGPGAYNVPSPDKFGKFGSSNKFTFRAASREDRKAQMQPGPGAYTPNNPNLRTRGGVPFTTTTRNPTPRNQSPGPGAYNVKLRPASACGTICKAGRDDRDLKAQAPGPGAYKPDYHKLSGPAGENTPRWSFGASTRRDEQASNKTPGPGAYTPKNFGNNTPRYSIPGKRSYSTGPATPGSGLMITTMG